MFIWTRPVSPSSGTLFLGMPFRYFRLKMVDYCNMYQIRFGSSTEDAEAFTHFSNFFLSVVTEATVCITLSMSRSYKLSCAQLWLNDNNRQPASPCCRSCTRLPHYPAHTPLMKNQSMLIKRIVCVNVVGTVPTNNYAYPDPVQKHYA